MIFDRHKIIVSIVYITSRLCLFNRTYVKYFRHEQYILPFLLVYLDVISCANCTEYRSSPSKATVDPYTDGLDSIAEEKGYVWFWGFDQVFGTTSEER